MSNTSNTNLINKAIELCDEVDKPYFYLELERLVSEGDLDGVSALIKEMEKVPHA